MALPTDKHFTARILERKDLSEDLWLIRVDPGGPFAFKAGQYATLGVDHEEKRIERAYSIVSSPYEESLEFFIEFVSYVRTLYRDWKAGNTPMPGEHKLFCLQGGSRSWEFGYREELERIAAEVPWFKYVATISRPWEDAAWKGQTGRVDDLVRMYVDEWDLHPEKTTGYLCGHPSMCENGMGILQRAGWQKGSLFEEVYFIPGKEVEA
jgi:ferredoxin--NADP+ reductase